VKQRHRQQDRPHHTGRPPRPCELSTASTAGRTIRTAKSYDTSRANVTERYQMIAIPNIAFKAEKTLGNGHHRSFLETDQAMAHGNTAWTIARVNGRCRSRGDNPATAFGAQITVTGSGYTLSTHLSTHLPAHLPNQRTGKAGESALSVA
jgi:hypothetical protein